MDAGKLIHLINLAVDNARNIVVFYVGKPFNISNVHRIETAINKKLESINNELLNELGIELYVEIVPSLKNCSVEGYLKVRQCITCKAQKGKIEG